MGDANDLEALVSRLGEQVAAKFSSGAGAAEDHLRGPVEALVRAFGQAWVARRSVVLAGEDRVPGLQVRPDFAVLVDEMPVGFVEVKSPGKGADPYRFRGEHDRRQWARLSSLPNVLYTDGDEWAVYSYGERCGDLARLDGSVDSAGASLAPRDGALERALTTFLGWEPTPPRTARELAVVSARLCRLLRDEVTELLAADSGLQALARDWRDMLFPDASNEEFADGYAQTVTFALLLARVEQIPLSHEDLSRVADKLADRHTLMGTALDVLTDQRVLADLAGSLTVLARVLAVVEWPELTEGHEEDAWLLFYEEFLAEYDPKLKKSTGSYYTPNAVVDAMAGMVDQLLRSRLGRHYGLAAPDVTVVDPAAGTGTYLFRTIERIAATVAAEEGSAEVPAKLRQAVGRLIGFELQTGPFAVAEFRLAEELRRRGAEPEPGALRLYVADTLEDPHAEQGRIPAVYQPIAASRQAANRVKADEPVVVVIGNPPYRERSYHEGGWVREGRPDQKQSAILDDFIPPVDWGVSEHVKHVYNPYVYFWRWASWKAFEQPAGDAFGDGHGVVALITVAGFLNGPGHTAMRAHLRRVADAIWVIDATPEGHQPPVSTRVFPGVQQPVCITIAVRDGTTSPDTPAPVYHTNVHGQQADKFAALGSLDLEDPTEWRQAPDQWTAPFLPAGRSQWTQMPRLDALLPWSGSGTMPGRTWVRAPSPETLRRRWRALLDAPTDHKAELLDEHPTDRTIDTVLRDNLPGYPPTPRSLRDETREIPDPERIAFRSFDRQWLIPDKRVINRPNPALWWTRSNHQTYLTAPAQVSPWQGPAATITGFVPDLDHYHGRGGRVFPLWRDPDASTPNVTPGLLDHLAHATGRPVTGEELYAYIAAILANPAYTQRFANDLTTPGLRVPLTGDPELLAEVAETGRQVIWLHTFGQRCADPAAARPAKPPRLDDARRPLVHVAIPTDPDRLPERIDYDANTWQLHVGDGLIAPVEPTAWHYQVSGLRILRHWFGYRKRDPEGVRSSPLDDITHDAWDPAWTTELLEIINTLTLLTELEAQQTQLLDQVLEGPLITVDELTHAAILHPDHDGIPRPPNRTTKPPKVARPGQAGFDSLNLAAED